LWIAIVIGIVIGFVNDFVIEKGFGKIGLIGAGRRVGEWWMGLDLQDAFFFISETLH
jgi:hypothetical protein